MVEQDVHYSHSRLFNNTNRVDFKPLLISNAAVGKAFETRQLWPAGTRMNCGFAEKWFRTDLTFTGTLLGCSRPAADASREANGAVVACWLR
jgi:hypothetical protein